MRAAIFDLDDTLYPYEQFMRGGFLAAARLIDRQFGIAASRVVDVLMHARAVARGREFQMACAAFGLNDSVIPALVHEFRHHTPELQLCDGADGMLNDLRDSGWKIAMLTNGLPHVQARKVHALGLHVRVDHVVYAAEYADGGKPHPAPFREVVRRLQVAAEQCVMVGDDPERDVRGGRAAGLRTVHVCHDTRSDCGADGVVQKVADVPTVINALLNRGGRHAA